MKNIRMLYGVLDTKTGNLVGYQKYAYKKYAWCNPQTVFNHFKKQFEEHPEYVLIKLEPQFIKEEGTIKPQ